MARRSRMSILKRQRELKKAEKASLKRARRHGIKEEFSEPTPTGWASDALRGEVAPAEQDPTDGGESKEQQDGKEQA